MRPHAILAIGMLALLAPPSPARAATGDPVLVAPAMPWPTPVTRTLANGLQVAVFPRHALPIVQIQLTLPAGSAEEGTLPQGTAALLAALVRSGTSSRDADQFQRDLEGLGGSMTASVTRDNAVIAAAFLADQLSPGLELLSDAVINPILPAGALETARRVAFSTLAPNWGSAAGLADENAWRAAFAPHPYERPMHGSVAGLLAVTPDDLHAMHRDHWRPDRACLVIAGDVDPEPAFSLAGEWFGRWSGAALSVADWPLPQPAFARITLVDVPGSTAAIQMVRPAPARGSPDLVSWTIATGLVQSSGRLPAGVRASLTPQREASLLALAAEVPVDSAVARIRAIQRVFVALAGRPPADAEVRRAREAYAQSMPQGIQTLGSLAAQWAVGRLVGLGDDHLARAAAAYASPQSGASTAAVWPLLAKPWVIVVAGPAAKLRPALAALGPVDLVRTDRAPGPVISAPPTAAERARGRELIAAAIAAHGGAAKLEAVRAIATEGEIELSAPVGNVVGKFSIMRARPDRFFMSTSVLEQSMQQVLVGDHGWTSAPAGDSLIVRDLDSSGVAMTRNLMENDVVTVLLAARDDDPAARGSERVDLKMADAVEYTTPHGVLQRLLFDSATHRLVALDFAKSQAGAWQERRKFSDFRLVGGVWIPFSEERLANGERLGVTTTRKAVVNPPVSPGLFADPRR